MVLSFFLFSIILNKIILCLEILWSFIFSFRSIIAIFILCTFFLLFNPKPVVKQDLIIERVNVKTESSFDTPFCPVLETGN